MRAGETITRGGGASVRDSTNPPDAEPPAARWVVSPPRRAGLWRDPASAPHPPKREVGLSALPSLRTPADFKGDLALRGGRCVWRQARLWAAIKSGKSAVAVQLARDCPGTHHRGPPNARDAMHRNLPCLWFAGLLRGQQIAKTGEIPGVDRDVQPVGALRRTFALHVAIESWMHRMWAQRRATAAKYRDK